MAETKLITRIRQAWDTLIERKAASDSPNFGRSGGRIDRFSDYRFSSFTRRATIDYRGEVGSLDGHSLVACVVNYTGTRLPEAKPVVRRTNKDGDVETDHQHPLVQLIRRPNRHHVWANYAHACSVSWWIDGNVYFKKVRDLTGGVVELWYIPHYLIESRWPNDGRSPEVKREKNIDSFLSHYQFNPPGRAPELWAVADVVHLKRGHLTEDRKASSPFAPLVKELYGDDKMSQFTASIMRNMGIQVPVISPKDKDVTITETKAAAIKEGWMQKTTGDRAGEPVILTEQIDVEKFGFSPSELDLSALRMIPESRVAAVTGIPAATLQLMVGLQNGTSYASSEQARQQGYEEVVIPIQQAWAEEINWQLLPEFKGSEGAEFDFDTSDVRVLQEDRDGKYKRTAEAFRAGITTLNEARTSIDKSNLGPDGDIYMVPMTASPTNLEQLTARADGSLKPEIDPLDADLLDVDSISKFMDMERVLAGLEKQMKDFSLRPPLKP